jgi:hypothetical protein
LPDVICVLKKNNKGFLYEMNREGFSDEMILEQKHEEDKVSTVNI